MASEGLTGRSDDVVCAAVAQMIAVRVGNHGRLYRLPGIDVEVSARAIKTAACDADESFWIGCHDWVLTIGAVLCNGVIRPCCNDINRASDVFTAAVGIRAILGAIRPRGGQEPVAAFARSS